MIKDIVLNKELISSIAAKAVEIQNAEKGDDDNLLKSELAKVKFELSNIYTAIGQGLFSAGLQERFEQFEARKVALENDGPFTIVLEL